MYRCEPCIEQLLANEYQRIWWQEKRTWDQNIITRQITGARKKILPRKVNECEIKYGYLGMIKFENNYS